LSLCTDTACRVEAERIDHDLGGWSLFNNFLGFPITPPDIEVLDDRELSPSDVLGCMQHPL
jgi:hypothetical protein